MSTKNRHLEKARRRAIRELHKADSQAKYQEQQAAKDLAKIKKVYHDAVVFALPVHATKDGSAEMKQEEALQLLKNDLTSRMGQEKAEAFFKETASEAEEPHQRYLKIKAIESSGSDEQKR